ncbi:TPA: hypothetical protein I4G60_17950 [Enterobacter hormaechei]|nr:hypothetical protein C3372_07315 [Enterobacter cloacae complex sp. ECNIH8]RXG02736.1 hypothetical protein DB360_17265 [Enterobacter cloacae]HAS1791123.1 hypothetical protein [Enterobacter hormaechei]
MALRLPGLRFGAAVAGWRFAYPAYGSVLLLPGGAALTRPTVWGRCRPGKRSATGRANGYLNNACTLFCL